VSRAQDTDACISASESAVGLHKAGKLIDARAALSKCAAPSCPEAVRTSCQQRLAVASDAIPSVLFFVKDSSGGDLAAVRLTIDGAVYSEHLDGSAVTLDPGEHEFRFEVAGQEPVVKRLLLHQGEKNRRENLVIGAAPAPAVTAPAPAPDAQPMDPGKTRRLTGLVVGGVGVAGLITGAIFGGLTFSETSSYMTHCGKMIGAPPGQCNVAGVSGEGTASTFGAVSTVAFIVGGVAAAGGAVLYFTAPKSATSRATGAQLPFTVAVGPTGLSFAGRF
jgi:hypothetical protein